MLSVKNTYKKYTPEEIFLVLQEDCRLRAFVDAEVDDDMEITKNMTLHEWRASLDLLPWNELYKFLNEIFRINISKECWMSVAENGCDKTLWDLCIFLSQHAIKEVVCPINICGKECLGAAVFLTLKKNLLLRGIEVENIRPSSSLKDFLSIDNFSLVIPELCKMGVKTFDLIKLKLRSDLSFADKVNIFNKHRYYLDTGSIKTFGDMSKRIAEQLRYSDGS